MGSLTKLIAAIERKRDGCVNLRDLCRRDKDVFGAAVHGAQADAFGECIDLLRLQDELWGVQSEGHGDA